MNAPAKIEPMTLQNLRAPFAEHHISKLPKETRSQIDARKANRSAGISCKVCGGWHHKDAIHLDYVGHAALTDRLLDTDLEWSWEPVAFNAEGLPAFDRNGGLWIKLTVLGVTRLGYGSADGKTGGDAIKEIIGDALRNAAMRFGAALDLWHKGALHADDDGPEDQNSTTPPAKKETAHSKLKTELRAFVHDMEGCGDWETWVGLREDKNSQRLISEVRQKLPQWWEGGPDMPEEFVPLHRRIEILEANLAEQKAQYATA